MHAISALGHWIARGALGQVCTVEMRIMLAIFAYDRGLFPKRMKNRGAGLRPSDPRVRSDAKAPDGRWRTPKNSGAGYVFIRHPHEWTLLADLNDVRLNNIGNQSIEFRSDRSVQVLRPTLRLPETRCRIPETRGLYHINHVLRRFSRPAPKTFFRDGY
jgi:hypothetical protein